MKGVSAKAVADAHQKDLKLQERYGVRFLTYWFDENRGSAFCLVDAPARERVSRLHAEAHGSIPNKILEVDPDTVSAFLGRIEDRQSGEAPADSDSPVDSAFRVIMFTDMKDSTAVNSRLGDAEAIEYFRSHNAITRDAITHHGGREIQHTGDGFMVSFTTASRAVACAVDLQRRLAAHNQRHSEAPIFVRIGICAGEPVEEDERLFGSTVQLTARICQAAGAEQILVAPVIRDLCLGKPFSFLDQGTSALKGFDEPVRLFEVPWKS
jgi:class 3 adenylate cyclase